MTIKLGKAAVGSYVRTGKTESSNRKVLGFVPAGATKMEGGQRGYFDPVSYPRYVIESGPSSWSNYSTVKTKTYIRHAKAFAAATEKS